MATIANVAAKNGDTQKTAPTSSCLPGKKEVPTGSGRDTVVTVRATPDSATPRIRLSLPEKIQAARQRSAPNTLIRSESADAPQLAH